MKTYKNENGKRKIRMETDRILLRKWTLDDAYILVENLNNETMANDLGTDYPYTYENARSYIEDAVKHDKEKYAIVYKRNMEVIGGCGLHITDKLAFGNMWISPKYHGRGIGTEASILLVERCFKDLKVDKMENAFFWGNDASRRMQEKVGAFVCGEKESVMVNGREKIKIKAVITKTNFETALAVLRGEQ